MKRWNALIAGSLLLGACTSTPAAEPAAAVTPDPLPRITANELADRLKHSDADLVVVDVRTPAEFSAGHVPGARNISHEQLPARLGELAASRDKQLVLYCRSGRRSQLAAQALREAGFTRLLQLEGDFPGWEAAGRPVETAPASSQED